MKTERTQEVKIQTKGKEKRRKWDKKKMSQKEEWRKQRKKGRQKDKNEW